MTETAPPSQPSARRAADGAPMLRMVVDALIDGHAVAWDAAEGRGCSPAEQRMMRQVRALTHLTPDSPERPSEFARRATRPGRPELVLSSLAALQVLVAVVTGLLDNHDAGSAFRIACLLAIVATAIALLHRGRVAVTERLLGHVLLLVAAWHARPLLDLAAAVGAPLWLLMTPQVVVVEAFLPVALWRLAQACPVPIRCSGFERVSSTAGAVAIACSAGVAVTCGLAALGVSTRAAVAGPWLVLAMALTWSIATAVTIAARSVPSHRRRLHLVPGARHEPWRPAVAARLASIVGLLRGTPTASLAALGADLQHARSAGEVVAALTAHVRASLDTSVVIVLLPGDPSWTAIERAVPPLPNDSATAALMASADEATRVDSGAGVHHLLPVADQEWLAAVGVATIVRLASKDGDTLAGLLVGPRRYGSAHTRRDRAYLSAAARSAAMALAPMSAAGRVTNSPAIDEDLSHECESCGQVGIGAQRCRCGGRATLAALPASLNAAFRVDRRIGRGGMGVVYLARDLRLHRMVALKTLPAMSPSWVASLLGEARAMAAVAHPSVAVLYGLEQWRGTPVLVTEYLSGGTLASRLSVARMPLPEALHLGASIADALAALHARGWLHRDIKPSNIGFAHDGALKLLDFGLTQWLPTLDDTAAPPAGTPLYLSPEILEGEPASHHDDVWALALTVVEMISGTHPFAAGGFDWKADMPEGVATVLSQALHPARSRRLASAQAFAAALRTAGVAVAC